MADVFLVPQMYNARRFKCDVAPYPTLCAISAFLETLPPFEATSPPQRRTGTRGSTRSTNLSQWKARSVIAVSIQPGRIALARTPWRASSTLSPT